MTAPSLSDWPERPLHDWAPLLTAAEGYPALERAALEAQSSIWLWFRVFDPTMELISDEARAEGLRSWLDLLRHRAAAGVHVAVAISDFDPLGAPSLHSGTWRACAALREVGKSGCCDVLVAAHDSRVGGVWRSLLWLPSLLRVEGLRRRFNADDRDAEQTLVEMPGMKRWLTARDGRLAWAKYGPPPLVPATHHQKIAVFDGRRTVIGGLDVDPRRYDTPDHDRPSPQTWRDLSLDLTGPIAGDVARHIAELWNAERARLGSDDINALTPPDDDAPTSPTPALRLSTTLSEGRRSSFALGPRNVSHGLETDHLALIERAERLLYLETQFLRSSKIRRALVRRARAQPALGLIIVLPAAPDSVAFDGKRDLASRFGEHLQTRALRALSNAFGDRLAVVSPARPVRRNSDSRDALEGSGIVYVHAKALVSDDAAAMVSSANLNGRSLRWDTEAGVVLTQGQAVRALRRRLFESLLPEDAPEEAFDLGAAPAAWRAIADRNETLAPEDRRGFLLPYARDPAERIAVPAPGLPEEAV